MILDVIGSTAHGTGTTDAAGTHARRYGMIARLRPEKRQEYLDLHAAVWPEVEATITRCGIRNFTIFVMGT